MICFHFFYKGFLLEVLETNEFTDFEPKEKNPENLYNNIAFHSSMTQLYQCFRALAYVPLRPAQALIQLGPGIFC